jgi:hypothetical protein
LSSWIFVAHSGTSAAGSFGQTMVLTDIATGWTDCSRRHQLDMRPNLH